MRGEIRDASGAPVAGVLVYVSAGLEEVVPPRPVQPAVLHWPPRLAHSTVPELLTIAQRYQPLQVHARDGRMHALRVPSR